MKMTQRELAESFTRQWEEIMQLRAAGQAEYAHDERNAFANFCRTAEDLELEPEEVLWIFAMKHRDGIAAWIKGHKSQREDVTGRINDLIVYLMILRGMVDARRKEPAPGKSMTFISGVTSQPVDSWALAQAPIDASYRTWPSDDNNS